MKRTRPSKSCSNCHAEALEACHGELVEPRRATFNRARTRRYLLYGSLALLPVSSGGSCPPETPPRSTTVRNPQIAVDGNGKGIAVWNENDGTDNSIYIRWYYGEAIGWGSATLVESGNDDPYYPKIAMDAAGNATVVWNQWDGTADSAYAARYNTTTGWGVGVPIESVSNNAGSPRIAMDPSGNAIAVWTNIAAGGNVIHANRYDYDAATGTGSWGSEVLIQNVGGNAQQAQIAMDASGNAIAVWMLYDPPNNTIRANRYIASTDSWGAEASIGNSYANSRGPWLAMSASGSAVALWMRSGGTLTERLVVANHYIGGWGTASAIQLGSEHHSSVIQVAMDASGNGIAVWMRRDGTTFNIYANRYTANCYADGSGCWLLDPELIENLSGDATDPQIAMDDNGNAIAVWQMSSNRDIYSNCYDGSNWQTEVKIGTGDDLGSPPQIAMDNNVAIAVWVENGVIKDRIWSPPFCAGWAP